MVSKMCSMMGPMVAAVAVHLIVAISIGESVSMFCIQVRVNMAVAVSIMHPSIPVSWGRLMI